MKKKATISLAVAVILLFATMTQLLETRSISSSFEAPAVTQSPSGQRGPRIDLLRHKVTRSPAAQLIEMTTGPPTGSDVWTGVIRPEDLEEMERQGKIISSRGGWHYTRIAFNMRRPPLDDVNFRHALAHLVPKDRVIGTVFRYVVVKVDTPVPPAQNPWYNDKVDPHAYSPAEAEAILADAGYQKIGGEWRGKDGSALPSLRFFMPLQVVMPTSYNICRTVIEECQGIGLNNIVATPMDFATYLDKTFNQWDFELSWLDHKLGRYPTHLYSQFSSENNYKGSENPHGIVYPDLDAELSTLWRSLDHTAKVVAVSNVQELLMGGSTISPLPHNVLPTDPEYQALPTVPVYSRNYYDVTPPGLQGAISMFGYGVDNPWTYMHAYWDTPNEYRPGTTERTLVHVEQEFPERLNPLWATTTFAWDYMSPTCDGLMATSPYTLRDEQWLANDWYYDSDGAGGMYVTFNINLLDSQSQTIKWQDGKAISINDVKFSWDFLKNWQIPNYWSAFRFYDPDNTVIVDADTIRAHTTTTSQWIIYDLARTAFLLPPQVWTQNPIANRAWANTAEILEFDPSAYSYPQAGNVNPGPNPLPTQLFGTGPFILQHSTQYIGLNGYGDMAANRNYFMATDEILDKIDYLFWRAGDCVDDDVINSIDLDLVMANWDLTVPPGDPRADITGPAGTPPDHYVGIDDLATVGKYQGETKTVHSEPLGEPSAPTPVVSMPLVIGGSVGETFDVVITIRTAENVHLWEIMLKYDSAVLSVTDVVEGDFLMAEGSTTFTARDLGKGYYKIGCELKVEGTGRTGDGVLAIVTFRILKEGESPLHFENVKLRDPSLVPIGRSTEDGYYQFYAAKVLIDPVTIVGSPPKIGETFTVDVKVVEVNNLYVWQAGLTFNAAVCEALEIFEGEFLQRAGVTTLWTPGTIDNLNGQIDISACSLTGPVPGVSGSGQLMNITFRVKESGDSTVKLTDVLLLDPSLSQITPVKTIWDTHARILAVGLEPSSHIRTEYYYVNERTPPSDWGEIGTTPYLNAAGDGSYIEGNAYCQLSSTFGFQDISLGPDEKITEVRVEGYTKADSLDIDFDVYDPSYHWYGSLWGSALWAWQSPRWTTDPVNVIYPGITNPVNFNNFKLLFHYYTPDGSPMGNADLDCVRLKVTIETEVITFDTEEVYPTWINPLVLAVQVQNQATQGETFSVTVYANAAAIDGTKTVDIAAGDKKTVLFSWDLAGFSEGDYTIRAVASVLYGDTETPACVFIDGTVRIKHPGDANGDGTLNAYDLGILAKAWGTSYGDLLFDARADFNGDLMINAEDHDILKIYWP